MIIKKIVLFILLLFSINLINHIYASTKWVTVEGKGSNEEDAFADARYQAIREAAGVRVLSVLSIFEVFKTGKESIKIREKYMQAISEARILEENIISTKWIIENEEPVYIIKLRLKIQKLQKKDPYFNIDFTFQPNRQNYLSGQEVIINITPTKDCYINVFNYAVDDSVYLVFPNPKDTMNYIRKEETKSIEILLYLLPNMEEGFEIIEVIATKKDYPFISFNEKRSWKSEVIQDNKYVAYNVVGVAENIAKWLIELPQSEWAFEQKSYYILK